MLVHLINPPPWATDFPPLNLAYLSEAVRQAGHDVRAFDLNIALYHEASLHEQPLWQREAYNQWRGDAFDEILARIQIPFDLVIRKILIGNPDLIGITCHAGNRQAARYILRTLQSQGYDGAILMGGTGVYSAEDRAQFVEPNITGFVVGDGEKPLSLLLTRPRSVWSAIKGYIPYEERLHSRSFRELINEPNLDAIPQPSFSHFDLSMYTYPGLPVLLGRGCRYRCAFCNEFALIPAYTTRSAQKAVEEILTHWERHKISHFHFNDLLLNGDLAQLEAFCDGIIASGHTHFSFVGQMNINPRMDVRYLQKLRKAGFSSINYGLESLSDTVLKAMNKGYTVEEARIVLERTKEAGLDTLVNIVVGFPGETDALFEETMANANRMRHLITNVCNLNDCMITPNSPMELRPKSFDILLPRKDHWKTWVSTSFDNTPAVRERRLARAVKSFHELGLLEELPFYVAPNFGSHTALSGLRVAEPHAPPERFAEEYQFTPGDYAKLLVPTPPDCSVLRMTVYADTSRLWQGFTACFPGKFDAVIERWAFWEQIPSRLRVELAYGDLRDDCFCIEKQCEVIVHSPCSASAGLGWIEMPHKLLVLGRTEVRSFPAHLTPSEIPKIAALHADTAWPSGARCSLSWNVHLREDAFFRVRITGSDAASGTNGATCGLTTTLFGNSLALLNGKGDSWAYTIGCEIARLPLLPGRYLLHAELVDAANPSSLLAPPLIEGLSVDGRTSSVLPWFPAALLPLSAKT